MRNDLLQRIVAAPVPPLAVCEAEAARLLDVSSRTMFKWRADGRGPRFVRIDGRILYAVAELSRWLDQAATGTAAAGGEERGQ